MDLYNEYTIHTIKLVLYIKETKRNSSGKLVRTGNKIQVGYIPREGGGYTRGVSSVRDSEGNVLSSTPNAIENQSLARGQNDQQNIQAVQSQQQFKSQLMDYGAAQQQSSLARIQAAREQSSVQSQKVNNQDGFSPFISRPSTDIIETGVRNQRARESKEDREYVDYLNRREVKEARLQRTIESKTGGRKEGNAVEKTIYYTALGTVGLPAQGALAAQDIIMAPKAAAYLARQKDREAVKLELKRNAKEAGTSTVESFSILDRSGRFNPAGTVNLISLGAGIAEVRAGTRVGGSGGGSNVVETNNLIQLEPGSILNPSRPSSTKENGLLYNKEVMKRAETENLAKSKQPFAIEVDGPQGKELQLTRAGEAFIDSLYRSTKNPSRPVAPRTNDVFVGSVRTSRNANTGGSLLGGSGKSRNVNVVAEQRLTSDLADLSGIKVGREVPVEGIKGGERTQSGIEFVQKQRLKNKNNNAARYELLSNINQGTKASQLPVKNSQRLISNDLFNQRVETVYPLKEVTTVREVPRFFEDSQGERTFFKVKEKVREIVPDTSKNPVFIGKRSGKTLGPQSLLEVERGSAIRASRDIRRGSPVDKPAPLFRMLDPAPQKDAVLNNMLPKSKNRVIDLTDTSMGKKGQAQLSLFKQKSITRQEPKLSRPTNVMEEFLPPRNAKARSVDEFPLRERSQEGFNQGRPSQLSSGVPITLALVLPNTKYSQRQDSGLGFDVGKLPGQERKVSTDRGFQGTSSGITRLTGFQSAVSTGALIGLGSFNPTNNMGGGGNPDFPGDPLRGLGGGSLPQGGFVQSDEFRNTGKKKNKFEPDFTAVFFNQKKVKGTKIVSDDFALPAFGRRLL